ncbi:hypothetical protein K3495_g6869 [Podosphaera aphanis]|nr:hypothetical protein K3495_g6869 [Podosphaera aphanis]
MDINATPAVGQCIEHDGKKYATIKEGLAYILVPAEAAKVPQQTPKGESQTQDVFYNPIQQFNRDLSVLAIRAFGEKLKEQQTKKLCGRGEKTARKRKRGQDVSDVPELEISSKAGTSGTVISGTNNVERNNSILEKLSGSPLTEIKSLEEVPNPGTLKSTEEDISMAKPTDAMEIDETQVKSNEKKTTTSYPCFTILDALSATGLRALRYAKEIPFVTSITANDLLPSATKQIKLNIEHNKLNLKIQVSTGNAASHMYNLVDAPQPSNCCTKPSKYSVIDLDPYGTAAPFMDAAVQAVQDGGLLCVTCTDAAVWASNGWPEKCYALYGGVPMKGSLSHEAGLRLILHSIATSAARYGLAITPLLSLSIDFYARVFVRIYKSASHVKFLAGKTMMVYNCDSGCGAWTTQMLGRNKYTTSKKGNEMWKHGFEQGPSAKETCAECGFKTHVGGPMYAGPIHSPEFIQQILNSLEDADKEIYQTIPRIQGMLTVALEECLSPIVSTTVSSTTDGKRASPTPPDPQSLITGPAAIDPAPFFFMLPNLSKVVHTVTPHENAIRGALRHLGYRVTRSHTKGGCIKTDAPWSLIWQVMRAWVKEKSPVKEASILENTAGWTILGLGLSEEQKKIRDSGTEAEGPGKIVFDENLGSEKDRNKLVRYQRNPRENWGPMSRAKGKPK